MLIGVAVVHGSGTWTQLPQPRLGSSDADIVRASELQHAVKRMDGDVHLGRPTLVRARAQPVADHLFPPPDGGLGSSAFVVPGPLLPSHAPVLGDALEMAVALRRRGLGIRRSYRARTRRHDDGRLGVARGNAGVNTVLVVRTVARDRRHGPRDLVEQGIGLGAVIHVVGGQRRGHDLAGVGIHAQVQKLWGGAGCGAPSALDASGWRRPMPRPEDLSRSLVALHQDSTLIAVIELSQSSWLVAGIVPGLERQPLKKLEPDQEALLRLLRRWQDEAAKAGRTIARIAVAFEAGRDGFWLARWLRARGIEAHVIHPTSVAVSREHRRAKTDRLDTGLLKRAFLGWLRGEPDHCTMAAVPTLEEEDARRPNRERESLVGERTRVVNRVKAGLARLGIRGFKPTLRNAPERLETLRTPEGAPLPFTPWPSC